MTDKVYHVAWAAEAVAVFQRHCRTGDEHAIADLICDLGHLAEERGFGLSQRAQAGHRALVRGASCWRRRESPSGRHSRHHHQPTLVAAEWPKAGQQSARGSVAERLRRAS